jgi:hypothetical protein
MEYTGVVCSVFVYSDCYKPFMQVSVDEAVLAYCHLASETFMLVLSQALYLSECQEPSLFCPYQMRSFGIVVDNFPKHISANCESTHSTFTLDLDLRFHCKHYWK